MECHRSKGYYSSNIENIPDVRGTYIYCITFLSRNIDKFKITTQHGLIHCDYINHYLDNINKLYDGLIIDYIIKIDGWGIIDKKTLKLYNEMIRSIGIKQLFIATSSFVDTEYNRNRLIAELQHVRVFLRKVEESQLLYLNTDITNLYGL